jgi:hypothetical protein
LTIEEFVKATNRLESYYGKEYTIEQRKIMYNLLKDWSIQDYIKGVTYCIENCKYLPKVADFKQMKADYKPNYTQQTDDFNYINCKKCTKGFVRYYKQFENYKCEYIALCTCENGRERKKQGYQYKFITEI